MSYDVLVVGGGVVGLTAALAMAKAQYSVALLDAGNLQLDQNLPDSRVYALNKASVRLLEELSVWPLLDKRQLSAYRGMQVWDVRSGASIDFDAKTVGSSELGFIVTDAQLKAALLQRLLQEPCLQLVPQAKVNAVTACDSAISISDGTQSWQGQLLMIADGAHSPLRDSLAVPMHHWSYHQEALIAHVTTEKPHQSKAYQVFHPEGPLAFLPLANRHECSIVWSCAFDQAKDLLALSPAAFEQALGEAFEHRLGAVRLLSLRRSFPLHMRHVKQYKGARWMLLGDAAHTIHPLAGLGLNLGLADVHAWLQCLAAFPGDTFSARQLGRYQRDRKNAVWQVIALMEGFKRLFGNKTQPLTALRGLGLGFCNASAPLKRLFINLAAGERLF